MAIEPRDDYRHSAETVRFVGVVGALLSGAAGLFALYKDLRFHRERRNEIDEAGEVETITDGVIRSILTMRRKLWRCSTNSISKIVRKSF